MKGYYEQLTTEKVYSLDDVFVYFWSLNIAVIKQTNHPFCQGMRVLLSSSALIFLVGLKLGDFSALELQCHTMMYIWHEERRLTVSDILACTVYYQNTLKNMI